MASNLASFRPNKEWFATKERELALAKRYARQKVSKEFH